MNTDTERIVGEHEVDCKIENWEVVTFLVEENDKEYKIVRGNILWDNKQYRTVTITVNSETTLYHYDQAGQLIAQTDDQGAIIQEYIYLDGMRLATMGKAKLATVTLDEEQTI